MDRWDAIIAINLSAVFHAMRATLPAMRERGWGRIINIASVHGVVGSAGKSAYVAAKHGVIGLTKVGRWNGGQQHHRQRHLPRLVLTPLVQQQIDALAAREGLSAEDAKRRLLGEKQPSASSSPRSRSASWRSSCAPARRTICAAPS